MVVAKMSQPAVIASIKCIDRLLQGDGRIKCAEKSSLPEDFDLGRSMRWNHPPAEFRKSDPRAAAVGFSIQFGARIGFHASKIFSYRSDLWSLARLSPYRLLTLCLQIAAIALLVAAGPRAAIESREFEAVGSSLISSADAANCNARAGEEAPAHPRRAHAQCCITCAAAGRDALAFLIADLYIAGYYFAPEANLSVAYFADRGFFPPVLGWVSSWSSRAPPVSP
ncbi:hypothetical protein V3H18_01045 [Methylocystis sp. 9N]|uniref:DUF2946 domain-containing protein n=1 Tax=Methylocystis borbori TaxID=3118750 RepID=A0ABU7XCJ8_9HYPH